MQERRQNLENMYAVNSYFTVFQKTSSISIVFGIRKVLDKCDMIGVKKSEKEKAARWNLRDKQRSCRLIHFCNCIKLSIDFIYLFIDLFIHSCIQQVFIEHLLSREHC